MKEYKIGDRVKIVHSCNSNLIGKLGTVVFVNCHFDSIGVKVNNWFHGHDLSRRLKDNSGWCFSRRDLTHYRSDTFWVVAGIGKDSHTTVSYPHNSFKSACARAEDMSKAMPKCTFYILEQVGSCKANINIEYEKTW